MFVLTQINSAPPGQPGAPGQPGQPGQPGAQPKAAPIMVTPYQHKWLICGKEEDNSEWDKYTDTEMWRQKVESLTSGELGQSMKKMANPKRICSRLIPGTAGAPSVKDSCVTQ
jgi:hypothetical protein